MWGLVWGSRAIPAIFVASMAASSAFAATVELTSVTGTFQNPLWNVDFHNVSNKTYDQLAADPRELGEQFIRDDEDNALWWGSSHPSWTTTTALTNDLLGKQSGYVFEGIAPADNFSSTHSSFVFGEFAHFNGEVWTNSATLASVEFWIDIEGRVVDGEESETFSLSTMFRLFHNETLNPAVVCDAGGTQPCRDSVVIEGDIAKSLPFIVGNVEYTFVLEGLVESINGPFVTSLFTDEFDRSSAVLRARIDPTELPPPVIPLPAAGWLLIAGIGGLAALARKKRRAA
jgi:hypothetical protein